MSEQCVHIWLIHAAYRNPQNNVVGTLTAEYEQRKSHIARLCGRTLPRKGLAGSESGQLERLGQQSLAALPNHIHVWGQMSKYLLPDSPSKAKRELLALEAYGMTKPSGLDEST